jgi:hypothetical protein
MVRDGTTPIPAAAQPVDRRAAKGVRSRLRLIAIIRDEILHLFASEERYYQPLAVNLKQSN